MKSNKLLFLFIVIAILVAIGLTSQYNSSKQLLIENFKNKQYSKSLHIRENFRLLFDKIQYDFRIVESQNIEKLNYLFEKYKNSNGNFDIEKTVKELNKDVRYGEYQIFLINKDYIIEKSSYKKDVGFNLGQFKIVKDLLQNVFDKTIRLDISAPKVDSSSMKLKRYLIRVSSDGKYILQIGYVLDFYKLLKNDFDRYSKELKQLNISLANQYSIQPIDFKSEKFTKLAFEKSWENTIKFLKEIKPVVKDKNTIDKLINTNIKKTTIKFNKELSKLFINDEKLISYLDLKNNQFLLYSITDGLFNDNDETKVLIKTAYDTSTLKDDINQSFYISLLIFIVILLIFISISIFITLHFKNTQLLKENKRFIADTVHQIRTPLTNIMMNSEMIKRNQIDDTMSEYVNQINASINMLTNSYEDLSYITSSDNIEYNPTNLSISEILEQRVKFFTTISKVSFKEIVSNIQSDITFNINQIELERLIDNNISNGIKYAQTNKPITINLIKDKGTATLEFKTFGKPIVDTDKIFEKNYREDESKRGLGLGLNMVKGICQKYDISYGVSYEDGQNIFTYRF
ncbi:MAG: HAMP domain-containing sensor histidine kinase [Campylobacterota bacterium]|nr:HAMP domain-containing sensor histidine kinase [Campylobacterota bacterium]